MGKQNKDVGCIGCFGWLLAVGLILYIIEVIFSFAIKNLPIIITVIFVALILFMLIALFQKKRKHSFGEEGFQGNNFLNKFVKNIPVEKQKIKDFDVESFAKECNSYVIREERKEQNQSVKELKHSKFNKEMSVLEANKKLQRTNELANIANKTTDRDEFYNSINEIKDILKELSKYEGKLPFIGSPSADLKNLEQIEQSQIELLEKRIKEDCNNNDFAEETIVEKDSTKESKPESDAKPKIINQKPKPYKKSMSAYDIERFAIECNAYVVREERREQEESDGEAD